MNKLVIIAALLVAGCNDNKLPSLPAPPTNTTVVTRDVPIPVLCKVEIARARTKIDDAQKGLVLEEQNTILRQTIAQQKSYIVALEAGIIGCGGKITK